MMARITALLVAAVFSFNGLAEPLFSIRPRNDPEHRRNLVFPQLASFVLPSFDQCLEHQYGAATVYAATAAGGLGLAGEASRSIDAKRLSREDLRDYDDVERQYVYGLQLYMFAGEMSAYHSFRTAVGSRRAYGEFDFLKADETPGELLLAPFDVGQAVKPRVFAPLLLVLALSLTDSSHDFHLNDAAFTAGTSFNAGVGEESLFRGYMMPLLRNETGSDFWSNTGTATLFALAHLSPTNRFPLIQGALGWYLGWLSQSRGWSLKESIFVHTWWDVIAIGVSIAQKDPKASLPLPGISFTF
jgi:hypothetical protein